mmetsp:Transcript_26117/g.39127  ORF Transcript_26117/g.39127 Transcript_26117/m.39127 type:complete len:88 (-) Transcript_26117:416-679(-)
MIRATKHPKKKDDSVSTSSAISNNLHEYSYRNRDRSADADAGAGAGTGVDIDNVDIGIDEGRDGRELEENDGDRPNIAIFGGPRGGG